MRVRNMVTRGFVLAAFAASLWGCSKANSNAPPVNASGQHPATWLADHRPAFLAELNRVGAPTDPTSWLSYLQTGFRGITTQCTQCHGIDLHGGISKVSCFTALFNGQACHANGPSQHPAGWRDPSAHGAFAKAQPGVNSGFSACRSCHGTDFAGGVSGVSCFSVSLATGTCHIRNGVSVGAPHSPIPWLTYPSPTHTSTVDDTAGLNAAACALCHTAGKNLRVPILSSYATGTPGCFNSTLCHGVMGHPPGWAQPKNHGEAGKSNLIYCQGCHADNPTGGPGSNPRFNVQLGRLVNGTTTGCEVCHAPLAAHPRVLQIPTAIFGNISTLNPIGTPWYLHCTVSPSGFGSCNRCHGANLDGVGAASGATGCTFCHINGLPTTLLNCTSCHVNPPNGTTYPNTGSAHNPTPQAVQSHTTINVTDICGECHMGLGSITLDHFNRAKLRTTSVQPNPVSFGAFTNMGNLGATYNSTTQQCTNTYCHGATIAGGSNKAPIWTDTNYLGAAGTVAGCGVCHGFPPPTAAHTGFTSSTLCATCHPHVNSTNTGFVDPSKHINGVIDVIAGAAHVFPYPGAVHMTAAVSPFTSCLACHTDSGAAGKNFPYPPAAGNPPDCQGCHTKAPPGNSCAGCHGTATNGGRPVGTAFPDVAGHHGSDHGSFSCATCHGTAGTGQTTHGPSNFTAHNDANVTTIIEVTNSTGVIYTRSGLGDGHGTCTGTCSGQGHNGDTW